MKRALLVMVLVAGVLVAVLWPEDPDAWRSFARNAGEEELQRLVDDTSPRWKHYLFALEGGDEEAFAVAGRLCPRITLSAHGSEEFLGALGWVLERRPADVLALGHRCYPDSPSPMVCMDIDEHADPEALRKSWARRRTAVETLLDGGLAEDARACLQALPR